MKREIAAIFTLLFITTHLFCQKTDPVNTDAVFILKGNTILLNKDSVEGVDMELKKDGKSITKIISGKKGKYQLQMDVSTNNPKNSYSLFISKEGTVPKTLSINTYIPPEEFKQFSIGRFYGFELEIKMIETTVRDIVDERPAGKIQWDINKHEFAFDQTYAKIRQREEEKIKEDPDKYFRELAEKRKKKNQYSIAGNLFANEENIPLENAKVNLVNKKGEVVQTTTTNLLGSYCFANLIQGEDYIIALVSVPPKITIKKTVMTSREGKTIAVSKDGNMFKYELLASDKNTLSQLTVDDSKLLMDIKGKLFSDKEKQTPLINAEVILKNAKGETVGVIVTDGKGFFRFVNLPSDQNYTLMLDEKDASLFSKAILLADTNGRILKIL